MIRAGHYRDSLAAALPDRLAASLDSIFAVEVTFRPDTEQHLIHITTRYGHLVDVRTQIEVDSFDELRRLADRRNLPISSPTTTIRPASSTGSTPTPCHPPTDNT